jgi:fluoride exporter
LRNILIVGLGGFLGANARYLLNQWMTSLVGPSFPWGTLVINISGSFLLAAFVGWSTTRASLPQEVRLLFATGFCGAYTTFSTFAADSIALIRAGDWLSGLGNVIGTNILCLLAALLGLILTSRTEAL